MIGALSEKLKAADIPYKKGVATATLCTFRIGGPAALLIEPRCKGELIAAVEACRKHAVEYVVLGKGSNLLFDDAPLPLVLIRTISLNAVRFEGDLIESDCGAALARLSVLCAKRGYADLSFACGIPGTLGGAIRMNAGAHGKELSDCVRSVCVYRAKSGEVKTLFPQELNFSYRDSVFQHNEDLILSAKLLLKEKADPSAVLGEIEALRMLRRRTQPVDLPSAGSTFRRTDADVPISRTLDELGIKGMRRGGAVVSEKHAGFIVNTGHATARDVRDLILDIQNIVERKKGFRPQPELQFVPSQYELFD